MSARLVRGKIHSSHGGRKAYLNIELKDHGRPEAARLRRVLDFKVQMRSGLPCDEWVDVAGAANIVEMRTPKRLNVSRFKNQLLTFDTSVLSHFAGIMAQLPQEI